MTPLRPLQFFIALLQLHDATSESVPWSVISYGRSPLHNKSVGGAADSRHLDWEAADLQPDDPAQLNSLKNHVRTAGLHYDDGHPGTLHVQLTPARPRAA